MKISRGGLAAAWLLPIIVPAVAMADHAHHAGHAASPNALASLVRSATAVYRDFNYAMTLGYEPGPCVSGAAGGAMGVHFVNTNLIDKAAPKVDEPEALIYEPLPNGGYRLVGVEYITLAGPAVLEGHLFNYLASPNRYGLPQAYELHVWAWKNNPDGTFADWNPNVSCDAYVPPPA